MNEWSYTSTPLYILTEWCVMNLLTRYVCTFADNFRCISFNVHHIDKCSHKPSEDLHQTPSTQLVGNMFHTTQCLPPPEFEIRKGLLNLYLVKTKQIVKNFFENLWASYLWTHSLHYLNHVVKNLLKTALFHKFFYYRYFIFFIAHDAQINTQA